jgi:hypothetical protein
LKGQNSIWRNLNRNLSQTSMRSVLAELEIRKHIIAKTITRWIMSGSTLLDAEQLKVEMEKK